MNFVNPTSRRFLCQHRNGDTFATNPTTDYVDYLQGNVIEKMKLVATYEVYTHSASTSLSPIVFETSGTQIKMTHPFNSWSIEGFVVGNTILVRDLSTGTTKSVTVNSIVGQDMYTTDTGFFAAMGWTSGDAQPNAIVKVTTPPTSLIFKFGLVPNSQTNNTYTSILDGQQQVYAVNGVGVGLTTLNYLSTESSNLGGVQAKYDGASGTDNYIYTFTVEHTFRIPHFIAQWLLNLAASGGLLNINPIPSEFQGTNSWRYVSSLNFGVNINNPNDGKQFTDEFQLGSVGFFDQNFNAAPTVYTVQTAPVYTVAGNVQDKPELTLTTSVTAQIKKNDGNFTAGVKGYLYHSRLTLPADYENNSDTYEENFILDQIDNVDGGGAVSSTILQNFTCTINGGDASLLDLAFDIIYPAADQAKFSQDEFIVLGLGVEDGALSATLSDRTIVKLDVTKLDINADVSGQITNFQPAIKYRGAGTDRTSVKSWINGLYTYDFSFDLTKAVDSSDALLTKLNFQIIARNTTTDDLFLIDDYQIPFPKDTGTLNVDGTDYQQINLDTSRFLSVPDGELTREVKLSCTAPGAYAATQTFTGNLGFIIPWREWIENNLVPNVFYDGSIPLEFFNKNKRTSNYSNVNGYDIYILLRAEVLAEGVFTEYGLITDKCTIYDFDVDGAAAGWTGDTKLYYPATSTNETDDIYNKDVRIEITMAMPTAGGLVNDFLAEICLEEKNNTGRHYRLHSSLDWQEAGNPLKPLVGESFVKITHDIPNNEVILECLVDGTMLNDTVDWHIYGHLRSNR